MLSTNTILFCLLLLAGGIAAQHSRLLPHSDLLQLLFVAFVVLIASRRCRAAGVLLLGFLVFSVAAKSNLERRLQVTFEGDSMLADVRILDFPRINGESVSMLVEPVADRRLPPRSRVTWFDPPNIPRLGETWTLELRLRRPRGNSNPGGFNVEDWMFREHIHASGYVVPGNRNTRIEAEPLTLNWRVRQSFVDFSLANGGRSAPVIAALGVGTRHLLAPDDWERYARTGTSHLMAISGLHVGLAATATLAVVTVLSALLRLPGNHLGHATIGAGLVASVYALVSGFAVPAQRATFMLALLALAFVLRRQPKPMLVVAQASIVVYMMDPVALLRPGFGLSFTAVIVLLWRANLERRPIRRGFVSGMTGGLRSLVAIQLALLVGLLPLTTLIFQRIALAAPAVNLLAVPVFSLVTVPSTLVSLLLHVALPDAAAILLQLAVASVLLIERLIGFFASLPWLHLELATSRMHWLLFACTCLWLLLPRAWPGRWVGLLAVVSIACARPDTPPRNCFDSHVLDVGQGLAVVVQSQSGTLLYDTAAAYRGSSAAHRVILPFLRYRGISAIDWLVVSHADNDHAGGVDAVHRGIAVGDVYAGELQGVLPPQSRQCTAGQSWSADGIDYEFLYPAAIARRKGNNASCVLAVTAGEHRLLLTGDIEAAAERDLLAGGALQRVDVLVIPHHGSETSSTPEFIARTRPDIAISSAAFGNRWNLPRESVVQRWRDAGASVLDTAGSGAVSFRLCARGGLHGLQRNRLAEQRFWHAVVPSQ